MRGPRSAGPSKATHGATAEITRASPLSKPFDSMCKGRNGNMHPTPIENKKIRLMSGKN